MTLLLDLPNEIVLPILSLVYAEDTEDIVSLSPCNKRHRLLSENLVKKHKEMRVQYRELEIGTFRQGVHHPQSIVPGLFLSAILENGTLGLYPTKVHMLSS